VTGETVETVFDVLGRFDAAAALGTVASLGEAVGRIDAIRLEARGDDPRGMGANAARCALELALMDAVCRAFGAGLGEAIACLGIADDRRAASAGPVRYSGAITAGPWYDEHIRTWKHRIYGFRQVKVKVGVPGQHDGFRMRYFRTVLGSKVDIRLDANEAWHAGDVAGRLARLRNWRPSLIEQPVPHAELDALAAGPDVGMPVLLDESLCSFSDGRRAVRLGMPVGFNVRLSKCGGIGPSLRLMELAWSHGAFVQLGCHPGETGILSAAGRWVAGLYPEIRYVEGSYDRHVLKANTIAEDITFGYGGVAPALQGPGLGVTVDPARLGPLVRRREVIDHD
jgi:muconate cycloisomerase